PRPPPAPPAPPPPRPPPREKKPEARAGLPARRPASCSAVTSTTSSTLPARAQRRRGADWLTAAPVSHRQRTSHQVRHACRGPPCSSDPEHGERTGRLPRNRQLRH